MRKKEEESDLSDEDEDDDDEGVSLTEKTSKKCFTKLPVASALILEAQLKLKIQKNGGSEKKPTLR